MVCGDKCPKFEPAVLICHGGCAQRIEKARIYYVALDSAHIWCQRG